MSLEFCSVQTIISSSSHFFSSAPAPEEDVRGFGSQDYECSFLTNVASLHLLYGLYEVSVTSVVVRSAISFLIFEEAYI